MSTTHTIPDTMKALTIQSEYKMLAVQDHPVPTIDADDVLVKTFAVALGPPDLLTISFQPTPGAILGSDWAGEIVQVGKNAATRTARRVGERVAGFVLGGRRPSESCPGGGAFAEYVRCRADLVWPIPDALSYAEAATMSIGVLTCAQALYHTGRLELPLPGDDAVERDEWVFVYGGSSSCGQYAIQLARASGFKVVTTASPRNFELLRSLGATAVVDYHDPAVVQKVQAAAAGNTIRYGVDAIALPATQELSQRVFGPAGGRLLTLLWANKDTVRADVDVSFTLVHTGLGRAFDMSGVHFPASPEDTAQMVAFVETIPALVRQGRLKPNPVRLLGAGGLGAIPQGLKYLEEGKVSGEKLVVLL
ncbi:GroES-like protein [Trametes gibbosa]|nr:GroES-like protein [Trametes gibbosa]